MAGRFHRGFTALHGFFFFFFSRWEEVESYSDGEEGAEGKR